LRKAKRRLSKRTAPKPISDRAAPKTTTDKGNGLVAPPTRAFPATMKPPAVSELRITRRASSALAYFHISP
jgi:hypothetical protein